MTVHNSWIYTIEDIIFSMNPMNEFTLKNGKTTTYAQYLLDNYKIKI